MFYMSQKRYEPARAHVPLACPKVRFVTLLELGNQRADHAQIWYVHRDPSAKRFAPVRSGVFPHVRTCHVHKPPNILLLYLDNHLADRAQIWHGRRGAPAKRFAIVRSGMHLHVRTCHVPKHPKIPLIDLSNHLADCAQIWYAHSDRSA